MRTGLLRDLRSMRIDRVGTKTADIIVCQFNAAQMGTSSTSRTELCHDYSDERQIDRRPNRAQRRGVVEDPPFYVCLLGDAESGWVRRAVCAGGVVAS